MTNLPMRGATEPTVTEDFGDPHSKGQQTDMASPEAAVGEGVEPEVTVANEVIADRGQEEDSQFEEGLHEEHPTNPVEASHSPIPGISPT